MWPLRGLSELVVCALCMAVLCTDCSTMDRDLYSQMCVCLRVRVCVVRCAGVHACVCAVEVSIVLR